MKTRTISLIAALGMLALPSLAYAEPGDGGEASVGADDDGLDAEAEYEGDNGSVGVGVDDDGTWTGEGTVNGGDGSIGGEVDSDGNWSGEAGVSGDEGSVSVGTDSDGNTTVTVGSGEAAEGGAFEITMTQDADGNTSVEATATVEGPGGIELTVGLDDEGNLTAETGVGVFELECTMGGCEVTMDDDATSDTWLEALAEAAAIINEATYELIEGYYDYELEEMYAQDLLNDALAALDAGDAELAQQLIDEYNQTAPDDSLLYNDDMGSLVEALEDHSWVELAGDVVEDLEQAAEDAGDIIDTGAEIIDDLLDGCTLYEALTYGCESSD